MADRAFFLGQQLFTLGRTWLLRHSGHDPDTEYQNDQCSAHHVGKSPRPPFTTSVPRSLRSENDGGYGTPRNFPRRVEKFPIDRLSVRVFQIAGVRQLAIGP